MKIKLLLLFAFGLLTRASYAQTTETFESQTNNSTTFISNSVTFNTVAVQQIFMLPT
jgi:hypothetical protein